MKEKVELEAKWSAESEKAFAAFQAKALKLGAGIGRPRVAAIRDFYLDTPEGFFGRRRIACRLRRADDEWELTLKSRNALKAGLASRRERTYSLGRLAGLEQAMARARTLLAVIPGHEDLKPMFLIANRRTVCPLTLADGTLAEASLDRVLIVRGKRRVKMLEIELEYLQGSRASFLFFVRSVGEERSFHPSVRSKVATALAAFSLEKRASGKAEDVFSWL